MANAPFHKASIPLVVYGAATVFEARRLNCPPSLQQHAPRVRQCSDIKMNNISLMDIQ